MDTSFERRFSFFLSLLLLLVIATGCVQPPFQPPTPPSAVTADMMARSDFWRNFQCKLRIDVDSNNVKFSSRAIVLIKAPEFIRFETFTPFGMTAALFVLNDTGPSLLIPSRSTVYTARQPETLVRRFLGGSLPIDLFGRLLTASIPPERLQNVQTRSQGATVRLVSKSSGSYLEWEFVSGGLARVFIGGAQFEGEVSYDPPVRLAVQSVPETIRISSKGWRMEVRVEQMRPSGEFQPGVFRLPVLPGMSRIDLDKEK